MQLLQGVLRFQRDVFPQVRPLFESLRHNQHPHTLMLTCSDSRVVPTMFTQTQPGEIFVIRNAGNMVTSGGGEEASIEYAIEHLRVRDIVICGHSDCGAVAALAEPAPTAPSALSSWLDRARTAPENVPTPIQDAAVETHVLLQLQCLDQLPAVARAVRNGKLRTHAWVYVLHTGDVLNYSRAACAFTYVNPNSVRATGEKPSGRLEVSA